ncbi:hypothetical protein KPL70_008889 [Citrus sinensis]|nr:hypothetical protein KPL70_008889 [Citrus sinensis]
MSCSCSDGEELLRSHNFNLSTTIGLRKHTRKTNRELSAEHKASHKKQCERIGCADAYSDNNESKTIKADKLTLKLGVRLTDFKNAIRDIGFGSLLEIQCGRLRRQLCRWLVDQFKPECNITELHGQNLKLCHRTFSYVMGVKDGGIPIQLGGPSENIAELQDIFQSTVKGINIKTLEDIIKQEDKTSWIFKVAFTLFALATLLCPTSGYISHLFLHPCNDVLNVKSLNWASFCYKWLAKSIGKYKNRETTYVGGCLLFLQVR